MPWSAGRAAGVHDVVLIGVGETGIGRFVHAGGGSQFAVALETGARFVTDQHELPDFGQIGANPAQHGGSGAIRQHDDAVGIPQQGGQAAVLEQGTARHDDDAGLGGGPVGGHQLQAVGQYRSHFFALANAAGQQGVGQLVDAGVELPIGQPLFATIKAGWSGR